jgi:transposase
MVARADYLFNANKCGNCDSAVLSVNEPTDILFWDAPNFGHPLLVQLTIPKIHCLARGSQPPLPSWLESKHMISKRLTEFILRRVCALETFKQISRDTGLSDTLVSDVFMERFETWDQGRGFDLPVRLGIDEVKTRGKYITVLVDVTRTKARVIDGYLERLRGQFLDWRDSRRWHVAESCEFAALSLRHYWPRPSIALQGVEYLHVYIDENLAKP